MGTKNQEIKVERIYFESGDEMAIVNGNVLSGGLSFNSQLLVSMTELNLLIGHLQARNADIDVYDFMTYTPLNEVDSFIEADFSCLAFNQIPLFLFENPERIKEIRA